jgi:hypothetical protein
MRGIATIPRTHNFSGRTRKHSIAKPANTSLLESDGTTSINQWLLRGESLHRSNTSFDRL